VAATNPLPMMNKTWLAALSGVVGGVVLLAAFRFAWVPADEHTHYHANFAVFVDGQRLDLSGDEYMEEISACKVGETVQPTQRVHLHSNNPDVVHVHHEGVTWGHLFTNLGMGLGEEYLALDDGPVLTEGEGRTLKVVLNGQPQFAVDNQLIRSGDRLLVSYGPASEEEVVASQFPAVADNAEEYNQRQDPAACAGAHETTLWDRVRHAFAG
jgi:hypothetical protein